MVRKYLNASTELAALRRVREGVTSGESLRSIAAEHGAQPQQIRHWRKQESTLKRAAFDKKTVSRGRRSQISHLEEQIVGWALEMRSLGVPIKHQVLQVKAASLDANFAQKSASKQCHQIRRLCIANCVGCRAVTHTAQVPPEDEFNKARDWLETVRPIVRAPNINKAHVANMDQVPVHLSMHPKRTLDLRGNKNVPSRRTGSGSQRFAVSCTVTANGSKLKPFAIFKGQVKGRIAQREFKEHSTKDELVLNCQPSAWQDGDNFLLWTKTVLVPHLQQKAEGTPVVLFLDEFSAHWTPEATTKFQQLGIQTCKIPGGCTGLVQPIDVGVGKPFRDRIRAKWWTWSMEGGTDRALFEAPSRELATTWADESWEELPEEIVRHNWMRHDLQCFLD